MRERSRRRSFGAEVVDRGAHFRAYAPRRERVDVVLEGERRPALALERGRDGFFSGFVDGVRAGARYWLRLDGRELCADPASRSQPEGPTGASELVDPSRFRWTDAGWSGLELRGQVLYELHVGTFTREGTFAAAARELRELRGAGVTAVQLMPLAEFPGRFGWGYDGVALYAPSHLYGGPEGLRAFVDRAHAEGIGVLLDVVYNHVGPSGSFLTRFSSRYVTDRYDNEWGSPIDFETEPAVRAFFVENAAYWVDEYHLDGLRMDATQSIHDRSERHVVAEMVESARRAAGRRKVLLVAENEPQHARLVRGGDAGGLGFDAMWNDDFHHAARVAATGRSEAYYGSTRGLPQELVSAMKWGTLYQGQYYPWQDKRRGTPALDVAPYRFVVYLQNHDQVSNSARGARLHQLTSPGRFRALTTLLLLVPSTPMLFQGQEFSASAPFVFFADHEPELARLVEQGRFEFLGQFPSFDRAARAMQRSPHDPQAFERCKLDLRERDAHRETYALHRELLRLRREDPVFSAQRADWLHGAVLGAEAFALRFAAGTGDDRLLLVALGADLDTTGIAEPLLAPPEGRVWSITFSSEDPRYGGSGTPPLRPHGRLTVPAHAALVLAPAAAPAEGRDTDRSTP